MEQKILNALSDENVSFFLASTPRLKELIVADEHPHIKSLRTDIKAELLSDKVFIIDRQDVIDFINGTLNDRDTFLLRTGEIRVVGAANVSVKRDSTNIA